MSLLNENCDKANEVSADFLMESYGNISNIYTVDTDSIYPLRSVRFTAVEENATYTWFLGAEVIHERSFVRLFDNSTIGQSIPVTLKVEKEPNHICFPDDDGLDSVIRYLGVASESYDSWSFYNEPQPKWEGMFKMLEEGENDSVEIKIYLGEGVNTLGDPFQDLLIFENLNGNNDSLQFQLSGVFFNILRIDNAIGVGCLDQGFIKRFYQNNQYEIFIPKSNTDNCVNRKTYHFKGRKLN